MLGHKHTLKLYSRANETFKEKSIWQTNKQKEKGKRQSSVQAKRTNAPKDGNLTSHVCVCAFVSVCECACVMRTQRATGDCQTIVEEEKKTWIGRVNVKEAEAEAETASKQQTGRTKCTTDYNLPLSVYRSRHTKA